jgi:hypothetical protein
LTATSLDAVGLRYAGTFPATGPAGDVRVLRFTMTRGSLTGLSLTQACAGGTSLVTDAESATLADTTFDAVSLTMTVGGTLVIFTADDPPTTTFPSEVVLQDFFLRATAVSADTLTVPSFTTQPAAC